ncbi:Sensor histidine kinase RcsC [Candidatus Methanoperedenaceae archaeon GB37]|nr:Sensor histidine kinase RcsC [Candidatus Methanoperedenaceae archaeon GB37]
MKEKKGQILVVDDNPQNLRVLGSMLKENGYRVALAENGIEAVKYAADKDPDLILLDIMMPEMDGIETCNRLKADDRTAEIPVIFITALTDTEDKLRAFNAGGVDYITKPFVLEEVMARVNGTIKRRMYEIERLEYMEKIEKTNEELELYSHILAHDLRNMLQVIDGYTDILYEEVPEKRELIEKISKPIGRALETIRDIRSLMKGKIEEIRETNLKKEIKDGIDAMTITFPRSTFRLHLPEEEIMVPANESLAQVFYNLLYNACIHNNNEVNVSVTVKREDGRAVIRVTDDGRGVDEEILPQIFERGKKGRESDGTGMGLYIVKRLVEHFNGTITAENLRGGGASFTVNLPSC